MQERKVLLNGYKGLICLVITLGVLQGRLWLGEGGIIEGLRLKREVSKQETLVLELKNRNIALKAELEDLKTRLDAIEERARADLGMVREGESFFYDKS